MVSKRTRISVIGLDFRIVHFILMLGSAFLLYSALGLDEDEGGFSTGLNMYYLHRNIGLLWGAVLVIYALYVVTVKRRARILEPIGRPIGEQIREGFSVVLKYFFHIRMSERVRTKMGRHNVMASYAFVFLILGLFLLAAGGLGMVLSPANMENEFFLAIHVGGAALLALFVVAHGFAVLNKSNRPLIRAVMFDGTVKKEWVDFSMPVYSKELERNNR